MKAVFLVLALLVLYTSAQVTQSSCKKLLDVAFVVDGSSSISRIDFEKYTKPFITNFISALPLDTVTQPNRISIVQVSSAQNTRLELPLTGNVKVINRAVQKLERLGGDSTDIAGGLRIAYNQLSTSVDLNHERVVILITDGRSSDKKQTTVEADRLKKDLKATLFTIGIGSGVSVADLDQLASLPVKSTSFHISLLKDIETLVNPIVNKSCGAPQQVTPKPTTAAPLTTLSPALDLDRAVLSADTTSASKKSSKKRSSKKTSSKKQSSEEKALKQIEKNLKKQKAQEKKAKREEEKHHATHKPKPSTRKPTRKPHADADSLRVSKIEKELQAEEQSEKKKQAEFENKELTKQEKLSQVHHKKKAEQAKKSAEEKQAKKEQAKKDRIAKLQKKKEQRKQRKEQEKKRKEEKLAKKKIELEAKRKLKAERAAKKAEENKIRQQKKIEQKKVKEELRKKRAEERRAKKQAERAQINKYKCKCPSVFKIRKLCGESGRKYASACHAKCRGDKLVKCPLCGKKPVCDKPDRVFQVGKEFVEKCEAPSTSAPTTSAPITTISAPTTSAPTTTTVAPTTSAPTTTTLAPTTSAPTTTLAPTTPAPTDEIVTVSSVTDESSISFSEQECKYKPRATNAKQQVCRSVQHNCVGGVCTTKLGVWKAQGNILYNH
ncbi:COL22A1 [Acrasis kona]|uniref:COL22A1 n=1 Tax=Acrasis kona TaxID=1008807 RepID=A0AAW2YUY0_9EUKA